MKVYIVTGEAFPNGMAATNRIKCYARALKEGGLDCEVVIIRSTELPDRIINNPNVTGTYYGVSYTHPGGKSIRAKVRAFRLYYDWKDRLISERYLSKKIKPGDVLFLFMGGKVEVMLRYMNVAKKKGAYCVRDLCELPYGTGIETEKAIRLRKVTIEKQFPKLDGIISISNALLNLARTYTLPSCKHIKVPIMVEYEHYKLDEKPCPPNVPYIFHAGTLYQQKDGVLGMIEAFGMAKQRLKKPIKYILTGSINQSSHPNEIRHLLQKYKIEESVEFVGYLLSDQIKEYLRNASLVISNRPKSKQDYYGFSTKLGEYMASATPLLLTNWGEAINWVENGKSAIITDPEDIEALSDAIEYVFTHPEDSKKIGLAGQEVCRKYFDYKNWSKPLVEFMYQLRK